MIFELYFDLTRQQDAVLHTTVSRDILTQTFGKPLQSIMQELGGPQWQELRQAFLDYAHSHEL